MKQDFLDYREYVPHNDLEFFAYTKELGLRKMFRSSRGVCGYMFSDCTHPYANCNANWVTIESWCYVRKELMTPNNYGINHYYHEKQGEEILKAVKAFNPIQYLKNIFNL